MLCYNLNFWKQFFFKFELRSVDDRFLLLSKLFGSRLSLVNRYNKELAFKVFLKPRENICKICFLIYTKLVHFLLL